MIQSIEIIGHQVPIYGIMAAAGCIAGYIMAILLAHKQSKEYKEDLTYIYVFSLVGAFIGAKMLYIITILPTFLGDIKYLFSDPDLFINSYFGAGFVMYGGAIAAFITAKHMAKSYGDNLTDFYPSLLPALAIVCGIGRIGCHFAGCCYGVETKANNPFAIIYSESLIAPSGIPLVPVQLIEAFIDFGICVLMIIMTQNRKSRDYSLYAYIVIYAIARFILEFFRGDSVRGVILQLSTSQWISVIILILTIAYLFVKQEKTAVLTNSKK